MVSNHPQKRAIRAYAEETGVKYTTALRAYEAGDLLVSPLGSTTALWDGTAPLDPTSVYLGPAIDGNPGMVTIDLDGAHVMIDGTARTGMRTTLALIVSQWATRTLPGERNTFVIDFDAKLTDDWSHAPGVRAFTAGDTETREQATRQLDALLREARHRAADETVERTPLLVAVPDFAEHVTSTFLGVPHVFHGSLGDSLLQLADEGADVGIHLAILGGRAADALPGVRDDFDVRIVTAATPSSFDRGYFRGGVSVPVIAARREGAPFQVGHARVQVGEGPVRMYRGLWLDRE